MLMVASPLTNTVIARKGKWLKKQRHLCLFAAQPDEAPFG